MFLPATQLLTVRLRGRAVGPRGGPQLARVQDTRSVGPWANPLHVLLHLWKGCSNFLSLDFSSGWLAGGKKSGGFGSKLLLDLVESLHTSQNTVHEQGLPQPLKFFLLLCKAWNRNDFVYLPRLSFVPPQLPACSDCSLFIFPDNLHCLCLASRKSLF